MFPVVDGEEKRATWFRYQMSLLLFQLDSIISNMVVMRNFLFNYLRKIGEDSSLGKIGLVKRFVANETIEHLDKEIVFIAK